MIVGSLLLVVYVYIALRVLYQFVTGKFSHTAEQQKQMTKEQIRNLKNVKCQAAYVGIKASVFAWYQYYVLDHEPLELTSLSWWGFVLFLFLIIVFSLVLDKMED